MEQKLDQLITVLEQTMGLYERMLSAIGEELAAATASDFERFRQAGTEKESLVFQLKKTEQCRDDLLRTIAGTLGIPFQKINISTLVSKIDSPRARHLSELGSALQDLITRVREANRETCMMVSHCLMLVKRSIGFFQHWTRLSTVYGQSGNICSDRRGGGRLVSDTV